MTGQDGNGRAIAFILVAMFTFATQDAITKTLAQDLAVAQIVMVRYWMFAAFASLLIAHRPGGIPQALRARRPWLQAFRSVIFVVEVGVFAWVVARLPLSTAQAIFAAAEDLPGLIERETSEQIRHNLDCGLIAKSKEDPETFRYSWRGLFFLYRQVVKDMVKLT